jgi:hypothetical protein
MGDANRNVGSRVAAELVNNGIISCRRKGTAHAVPKAPVIKRYTDNLERPERKSCAVP